MSDRAKIRARRVTGNDTQQQREIAKAIKNAREMALLPYATRVTSTQRTSKGDRGDRGRADGPPPRPSGPPPGGDEALDAEPTRWATSMLSTTDRRRRLRASTRATTRRSRREGHPPCRRRAASASAATSSTSPTATPATSWCPRGLAMKASAGGRRPGRGDAPGPRRRATPPTAPPPRRSPPSWCPPASRSRPGPAPKGKLFGSVTTTDIVEAVQAQTGIELDRRDAAPRRADQDRRRAHRPRPASTPRSSSPSPSTSSPSSPAAASPSGPTRAGVTEHGRLRLSWSTGAPQELAARLGAPMRSTGRRWENGGSLP